MRLTVNLEEELYRVAKALAKAEDISLSEAVNRLIRRALQPTAPKLKAGRALFPTVRGARPFGPDDVAQTDLES